MRYIIFGIILLVTLSIISACTSNKGLAQPDNEGASTMKNSENTDIKPSIGEIQPEEAKKRLESEEGIILLDVRTPEEYADKHIPDSILIPVDEITDKAPEQIPDKDTVLFVYCRSGNRSTTASRTLIDLGYTNVFNLGGIIDWPYETESGR